jgi:hypothetical protein
MAIKLHFFLCNISTVSPGRSESYYACDDQQKPHFRSHGVSTRVLHLSSLIVLEVYLLQLHPQLIHTQMVHSVTSVSFYFFEHAPGNKIFKIKLQILQYFMYFM